MSEPLGPKETSVSKKGMDPCSLGVFVVNCMWRLSEFRWVGNSCCVLPCG